MHTQPRLKRAAPQPQAVTGALAPKLARLGVEHPDDILFVLPLRYEDRTRVVTIGGLGSFAGAIIAGLLVGVVTALTIQFKPEAAGAALYVFMAIVLLIRPRGLLGERWERFE